MCVSGNESEECVICLPNHYYEYVEDRSKFYQCVHDMLVLRDCPEGTVWSKNLTTCVHDSKYIKLDSFFILKFYYQIFILNYIVFLNKTLYVLNLQCKRQR